MLAQECNHCRKKVWCVLAHILSNSVECQRDQDRCVIEAHSDILKCFQNVVSS